MHQHNHAKSTVLCWYKYRITLSSEQKHFIFTSSSSHKFFFYFCLLQSLGTLSYSVGCETILSIALLLSAESCERNRLIQSFSDLPLDSHILQGKMQVVHILWSQSFLCSFLYFEGKGHSCFHLHFNVIFWLRLQYFTVRLWPGTVLNSLKLWYYIWEIYGILFHCKQILTAWLQHHWYWRDGKHCPSTFANIIFYKAMGTACTYGKQKFALN